MYKFYEHFILFESEIYIYRTYNPSVIDINHCNDSRTEKCTQEKATFISKKFTFFKKQIS